VKVSVEGVRGIEHQQERKLDLRASSALVAASEMLELPSYALDAVVQEALNQNPALERLDAAECAACRDRWPTRCPVCAPGMLSGQVAGAATATGPATALGWTAADRPARPTDADELLVLVRMAIPARDIPIAEYVVGSLDHHGRLDASPEEIAAALGAAESAVLRVLAAVRQNGPSGVGARSAAECLLLQLDDIDSVEETVRALARSVIARHLPALARGNLAAIAAALEVDQDSVAQVHRLIRERLRPYPAFEGHVPLPNPRIVPDLVIYQRPGELGEFGVELVEPRRLRLGIVPGYRQLPGKTPLSEARQLLRQLRDRWETLRQVATYTIDRQKAFVRGGPAGLQSLTRAEVARALGLSQSTVSRATADRYAILPSHQIVPMAAFFSTSGGLAEELRRLVATEERPLSDEELVAGLSAQGYQVARRTVTKYRIKLGIAPASQR
jgi:RNA polymerase sigma-54 factor